MGVKVTGQFEPAGEFSIVDAKDVSGNITSSNIQLSGNISGSTTSTGSFGRLEIIGNSVLGGDLDLTGNITIGDSDTDSLTITADLTSNLIPNADSTFNLGSPTKNWKEGYIEELSSTNITASGNISGSGISTGSLAHLHVTNNIGVGTLSPLATVHISASDGIIIPVGTTSQRSGDAVRGEIRFNTEIQTYEGYDGNNWGSLGGMTDVDKDTLITAENSAGEDNDELKFFTAGVERLRIFADGHISASGNITASGNIIGTNLVADSSSFSARVTAVTSSISELKTDSGSFSLRNTGFETIMINCNPETVSTDYDTSDRLYFEPLKEEYVFNIINREKEKGNLVGIIAQFGGQTPIKLAKFLHDNKLPILGTQYTSIDLAEDRDRFRKLLNKLK